MAKHEYRVLDTYPCPKLVAPYIWIVTTTAKAQFESIWRGDDPVGQALENKYGHHSQAQLFDATPAQRRAWGVIGTPDRPGESTHELKSDGVAFPHYPRGADLLWWMQGWDVNGAAQADDCIRAAARFGFKVFRPYTSGAEVHHLCFAEEPKGRTVAMRARVVRLRTAPVKLGGLPRS